MQAVIDLDRYPIDDPDLGAELHEQMRRDGVCELPGFLRHEAVDEAVTEALVLADDWSPPTRSTSSTSSRSTPRRGDPRGIRLRSSKKQIAYDQIPRDSSVRRMYRNEQIARFVAGVLGREELHLLDDPPAALGYAYMEKDDTLAWQHVISLDPAPGTLTLFRGRRSLHRVSPVEGERLRVNAVLAYGDRPGMRLNDLTQRLFYGRRVA
jgi:hypothetical protein